MANTARACTDTVATNSSIYQSAVCGGGHEMRAGVHCAHFELRELNDGEAMVGVAGPGFDPAAGGGMAWHSAEGWVMEAYDGNLRHGYSDSKWAGQPQEIKGGDVVVRRPPCAAPRHGCAEGLARARRAWRSTSTPAGEAHCQLACIASLLTAVVACAA